MTGSNVISAALIQQQRRSQRNRQQIGQSIVAFLAGSSEPKINRAGKNWRVFDPISGQTLHFSTEQDVRIWLDERYSR